MIAINISVIYDVTHLVVHHLLTAVVAFEQAEELDYIGVLRGAMRGQLRAVDALGAAHRVCTAPSIVARAVTEDYAHQCQTGRRCRRSIGPASSGLLGDTAG